MLFSGYTLKGLAALSAGLFMLSGCSSSETVELNLENELNACLSKDQAAVTSRLPTSNELHAQLVAENPRFSHDENLYRRLRESIPPEEMTELVLRVENSKRDFIDYRRENPVRGGIVGTATSGFYGAEYRFEDHQMFEGLIEVLPIYQASELYVARDRLLAELRGMLMLYRERLTADCKRDSNSPFDDNCGMWFKLNFDMGEFVAPSSAEDKLALALYESGAWDKVRELRPKPRLITPEVNPWRKDTCVEWYLGDQTASDYQDIPSCHFEVFAAINANRSDMAEMAVRRMWASATENENLDHFFDYSSLIPLSTLVYSVTEDKAPIRRLAKRAMRAEDWKGKVTIPTERAAMLSRDCLTVLSKTQCNYLLSDILAKKSFCDPERIEEGQQNVKICRRAISSVHPKLILEDGYEAGAVIAAQASKATYQSELLMELSQSVDFLSAVNGVCEAAQDYSTHWRVLGLSKNNAHAELRAYTQLMAHQIVGLVAMRNGDLETARLRFAQAFALLDPQSDRLSFVTIVLTPYGESTRDLQTAVMLLLVAELEMLERSVAK